MRFSEWINLSEPIIIIWVIIKLRFKFVFDLSSDTYECMPFIQKRIKAVTKLWQLQWFLLLLYFWIKRLNLICICCTSSGKKSLWFVSEMAGKEDAQRLWQLTRFSSGPFLNSFAQTESTENSTRSFFFSLCVYVSLFSVFCCSVWFLHSAWVVPFAFVLGTLAHASVTTPESKNKTLFQLTGKRILVTAPWVLIYECFYGDKLTVFIIYCDEFVEAFKKHFSLMLHVDLPQLIQQLTLW